MCQDACVANPSKSRSSPRQSNRQAAQQKSGIEVLKVDAEDGHSFDVPYIVPHGKGPFPVVIYQHGGLRQRDLDQLSDLLLKNAGMSEFYRNGYITICSTFRTCEDVLEYDGMTKDLLAVVDAAKSLQQADPESVVYYGMSGGGSVGLELAAARAEVAAIALGEPACTLFARMHTKPDWPTRRKFDADPHRYYTEKVREYTEAKLAKITCPVLFVQGNVHPINIVTKEIIYPTLQRMGKNVEMKVYPGKKHGFFFNPGRESNNLFNDVDQFFKRHLPAEPTGQPRQQRRSRHGNQKTQEPRGEPRSTSWVYPVKKEPEGSKYKVFHSRTIGGDVSYLIYLPREYGQFPHKRYPVVYWLPGGPGRQTILEPFVKRLKPAIKAGDAPPMIVVGVNAIDRSFYCDSKDGKWPVETVIIKDLIPHIDQTYRTIATRRGRALEGFSMGGFGVFHFGLKYTEKFGVLSCLAGALLDADSMPSEARWGRQTRRNSFREVFGGDIEYFNTNSPWTLIERQAELIRGRTAVRIVVGENDMTLKLNRKFHELLEKLDIPHEFNVIPSIGHNHHGIYSNEEHRRRSWRFYSRAFGNHVSSEEKQP